MSLYIDSASHLHHDQEKNLVVTCPHCQAVAHITPTAVPRFEDLQLYRPNQVGIVYLCDACHAPIFLRFTVRVYGTTRIELSPQFTEVERAREKFSFAYVPEDVELLFREALTCFSQGAFNAFASMCRRTAQAMFADLGEAGRLRLFDEFNAVRELADIAPEIFAKLKSVLFGAELDARSALPLLDGYEAGIMLEVAKDLLYEAYVRKGKLQQAERALRVRHGDGHAPVKVRQRRDAEGRAAGIGGIGAGEAAVVVEVAKPHQAAPRAGRGGGARLELCPPLAVRHRNGQDRARHVLQQHRRGAQHLDLREACLVLLAAVAHEARPVRAARDDDLERGEHLATVADAEREAVGSCEEALELRARPLVEQDRFRPALARPQHIAIGEAADRK